MHRTLAILTACALLGCAGSIPGVGVSIDAKGLRLDVDWIGVGCDALEGLGMPDGGLCGTPAPGLADPFATWVSS